jgi:hypothetical protein
MESALRPRDIQARIRSGESPESVAAAAQTTVDRIMGFAAPVLAERAYVAQQAQKASVRRRTGDGPAGHLEEAVARRLTESDVDPESVEWDAWRREDGRWTLVADYPSAEGQQRAQFVFDLANRYVVADDDESRRLVGERVPGGGPVVDPASEQVALGDDAIALVTGRPLAAVVDPDELPAERRTDELPDEPVDESTDEPPVEPAEDATDDLTEVARPFRPTAPAPAASPDWIATQASERPTPPATPVASAPAEPAAPAPAARATEPAADQAALFEVPPPPEPEVSPQSPEDNVEETLPEAGQPEPKSRRSGRAKGRASVPTWDEIMFGSAKNE